MVRSIVSRSSLAISLQFSFAEVPERAPSSIMAGLFRKLEALS